MIKYSVSIFFIILLSSFTTLAKVIVVENSVAGAITEARAGDTLLIKKNTYHENSLVINKPLTIIGENQPEIDAGNKGKDLILVTSNNVHISGFTLRNIPVSYTSDNAAIKFSKIRYCSATNNIVLSSFFGIYLAESSDCNILNNKLQATGDHETSSGNGIHLWHCNNIQIENNEISHHRDGIYFEFVTASLVANNFSHGNLRYGLHFMFSDSCTYYRNHFDGNHAGVAVMYTKNIVMQENIFENSLGAASYGLLLKDIRDSRIERNTFKLNTIGIFSDGNSRIHLEMNNFLSNGWAVKVMANSEENVFTRNNFIGNSFDVATNSINNTNVFAYNYWSYYDGYDLDSDGFGDVPYRPVRLFSYLCSQNEPALILLHSFFISILDAAERIFPFLTPETLIDKTPSMKEIAT